VYADQSPEAGQEPENSQAPPSDTNMQIEVQEKQSAEE
jgi:hypothetical protein